MKLSQGAILIAIGFTLLYLIVTGKVDCFAQAFRCAFIPSTSQSATGTKKALYTPGQYTSGGRTAMTF